MTRAGSVPAMTPTTTRFVGLLAAGAAMALAAACGDDGANHDLAARTSPPGTSSTPATATATTTASPTAHYTARRALTFIAEGDAGTSGPLVGCGDSSVTVPFTTTTIAPLSEVMRAQLAVNDDHYGDSGLYNALYRSDLDFAAASIDAGHATVELTGTLRMGGECDIPRVREQLTAPALQFDNVDTVTVTIDGEPLDDILDLRG